MNIINKITIYLFAFLLPLQTHYLFRAGVINNGPWDFGHIALYGLDLLLILVLIISSIVKRQQEWQIGKFYRGLRWLLPLFIITCLLSFNIAPDQTLAWYGLGRLLAGLILFQIIANSRIQRTTLINVFIASAVIQALWGTWQFLSQSTFANKWLGLALHLNESAGTSVIEVMSSEGVQERWLRAYGALPHPNILGAFLSIALILSFGLIVRQIARTDQTEMEKSRFNWSDTLWYFSLPILSAGLFFTFSRTAILATGVGLLVILLYKLPLIKKITIPLLLIILTVGALSIQCGYIYNSRWQGATRLEIKSDTERLDYIANSLSLIKSRPWTGFGIANFGLAIYSEKIAVKQLSYYYQPVHNVFLLIASESGVIALAIFVLLLALISVRVIQPRFSASYAPLNAGLIGALLTLMIFDHYLWSQMTGIYLLWFSLGLMVNTAQSDINETQGITMIN